MSDPASRASIMARETLSLPSGDNPVVNISSLSTTTIVTPTSHALRRRRVRSALTAPTLAAIKDAATVVTLRGSSSVGGRRSGGPEVSPRSPLHSGIIRHQSNSGLCSPSAVVAFLRERATMAARLAILTVGILLVATGAGAQSAGRARRALRAILFRGEAGTTGALSENSSAALYGLLLGETTTFPTGTSAGGFTWTFDDTLHVPVRRSRSFGPMFAERPFTTGKGKLNVGAAFQHTTFSSVGGRSLSDLETSVTYESGDCIYRSTSSLDVQLDRTIVSATYGLHNKSRHRGDCALWQRPRLRVRLRLPAGERRRRRHRAHRQQRLVVRHRRHPASNEGCPHGERRLRRRCSGGHPPANG